MSAPNRNSSISSSDKRIFIDPARFQPKGTFQVRRAKTWLRRAGRPSASVDTELIYGEQFTVYEIKRGWAFGQVSRAWMGEHALPGYVGYVRRPDLASPDLASPDFANSGLTSPERPPDWQVSSLRAPVFKAPDIKTALAAILPLNALLRGEAKLGDFIKTDLGFMHKNHIKQIAAKNTKPADYVTLAESLLGLPYIWGGVSTDGLDCSGLVQTALRANGCDAPRDSDQQSQMGSPIAALSQLRRGDLVFWRGHVGIMQNETKLLHANAHHMKVASETLSAAISRIKESVGEITALRRL